MTDVNKEHTPLYGNDGGECFLGDLVERLLMIKMEQKQPEDAWKRILSNPYLTSNVPISTKAPQSTNQKGKSHSTDCSLNTEVDPSLAVDAVQYHL